jgi:hypothetical protein
MRTGAGRHGVETEREGERERGRERAGENNGSDAAGLHVCDLCLQLIDVV